MRRRNRFLKRSPKSDEMSLQITSMADIFMILLVFLLKSYNSGAITISPSQGMTLPTANLSDQSAQGVKVEVSEQSVTVEGHPVSQISQFAFASGDLDPNGVSKSLSSALEKERAREQVGPEHPADARIVVIADQRAPYQTIKTVLASAAVQGYTDIKLAVVHAD